MSRIVVNVATYGGYLHTGQPRLRDSLIRHGNHPHIFWSGTLPAGSPSHAEHPYAFKLYAIEEARARGFTTVLWCDAAVWAVKDLTPFFERIERDGHYFFHGGASLGQRCSDEALKIMRFDREEAFKIPLIGGTVYGFDFNNPRTQQFYMEWWELYRRGAFQGFAINDKAQDDMRGLAGRPKGHVSDDPRVQGHNHDESVATVLAHRLGMASVGIGDGFNPYSPEAAADPKVFLVSQGL
jgi:hypothetical protein